VDRHKNNRTEILTCAGRAKVLACDQAQSDLWCVLLLLQVSESERTYHSIESEGGGGTVARRKVTVVESDGRGSGGDLPV
jgi:hypothetical protein